MPVKTKRWNDPVDRDDGHGLLVCRYRPRGVRKDAETWDAWSPQLGRSRELHAAFYGRAGHRSTGPSSAIATSRRWRVNGKGRCDCRTRCGRRDDHPALLVTAVGQNPAINSYVRRP